MKTPTMLRRMRVGSFITHIPVRASKLTLDVVLMDRSANPVEEEFDVAIVYGGVLSKVVWRLTQKVWWL
jgi:hypothetical protein